MIKIIANWYNRYFSDSQVIILNALLLLGFIFIYLFGDMLVSVFVAVLIAYLLDGFVPVLQRLRIPRNVAVVIIFLLFIAVFLTLMIVLLPIMYRQTVEFFQELPGMLAKGQEELTHLPERYPQYVSQEHVTRFFAYIETHIQDLGQYVLSLSVSSVRGIIELLIYLILVPFLVFFFLKDKDLILQWFASLLPEERNLAARVWDEMNVQIANYLRGKGWEIIIVWVVSYGVFSFMGLRFTMLLSLFTGLSVLLPYVGATLMTFPIALVAFFQWGLDVHFVYILIAYGILQALDGNVLAPLLLAEVVNIHPIAVIIAILLFGGLWGFWGLLFAIPLATLVHAVYKAWRSSLANAVPHGAADKYQTLAESCSDDKRNG